jgi:hypothetical protein
MALFALNGRFCPRISPKIFFGFFIIML